MHEIPGPDTWTPLASDHLGAIWIIDHSLEYSKWHPALSGTHPRGALLKLWHTRLFRGPVKWNYCPTIETTGTGDRPESREMTLLRIATAPRDHRTFSFLRHCLTCSESCRAVMQLETISQVPSCYRMSVYMAAAGALRDLPSVRPTLGLWIVYYLD